MSTNARTHAEQVSADFWDWMGPKMDAWADERAEQVASMPERDEASRTILGAEALEIEFEPVAQVPGLRTDVMAELAIW